MGNIRLNTKKQDLFRTLSSMVSVLSCMNFNLKNKKQLIKQLQKKLPKQKSSEICFGIGHAIESVACHIGTSYVRNRGRQGANAIDETIVSSKTNCTYRMK